MSEAVWDAGDLGCGELVLALRGRLLALPPGGLLRLTGHELVEAEHPVYLIRRQRTDPWPVPASSACP